MEYLPRFSGFSASAQVTLSLPPFFRVLIDSLPHSPINTRISYFRGGKAKWFYKVKVENGSDKKEKRERREEQELSLQASPSPLSSSQPLNPLIQNPRRVLY